MTSARGPIHLKMKGKNMFLAFQSLKALSGLWNKFNKQGNYSKGT